MTGGVNGGQHIDITNWYCWALLLVLCRTTNPISLSLSLCASEHDGRSEWRPAYHRRYQRQQDHAHEPQLSTVGLLSMRVSSFHSNIKHALSLWYIRWHSLSHWGVWASSGHPKFLKNHHSGHPKNLWGISWNVNLKHIIDIFYLKEISR